MARAISVAIVGLGSRGLSVLERIVTLAKKAGPDAVTVRIEVIDPTCSGAGVHAIDQPDYLLLNTTAAAVSMFPDAATVGSDVDEPGPSLFDWVTERGLRVAEDGFTVGTEGRLIRPTDFLPRRVLGEYLGYFLEEVLRRAPEHVAVRLHRAEAVDLTSEPDGSLTVTLAGGGVVRTDYAFLTTGYTANEPATANPAAANSRFVSEPYELLARSAELAPGQVVAIGGFGLSAMDLMSSLTVGRGGRFIGAGNQHRYQPSGQEPTLLMYSRSGVPCRARPLVTKWDFKYEPLALTRAAIDELRADRAGALDFDRDILPLALLEMRIAYRRCEARCAGPDAQAALAERLGRARGRDDLAALMDALDLELGAFDAVSTFDGSSGMLLDDSAGYQKWFAEVLRRDLAEGLLGFSASPVKAALDVLRDSRDTIRYAVDFGGLTGASLDQFTRRTVPLMNRAVVGPQYERHSELLALMEAGVLQVPFGPAPSVRWNDQTGRWTISSSQLAIGHAQEADWLVAANLSLPAVASSASPLIRAMYAKGLLRRHRPEGSEVTGVDVTADQHPVDRDGTPDRRMWVLGPLCEGATFYNNLVPSPGVYSRPIFDAHRCAVALLDLAR